MDFRITGLPAEQFAGLFSLSDEELATRRAVRQIAGRGAPCRISLTDAAPGDEVILIHYVNHPVETPFRSAFAIYVRVGEETYDEINTVPEQLVRRTLSVRAYGQAGMLVTAVLIDGRELATMIPELFADPRTRYLHVHFATYGCYAAKIERAQAA